LEDKQATNQQMNSTSSSNQQSDFGWHHHDQEHVDGWGHFQKRLDNSEYASELHLFPSQSPGQLTWEIMTDLASQIKSE